MLDAEDMDVVEVGDEGCICSSSGGGDNDNGNELSTPPSYGVLSSSSRRVRRAINLSIPYYAKMALRVRVNY